MILSKLNSWSLRIFRAIILVSLFISAEAKADIPWSPKESRLASEYLNLLVEKPEYGRVLDLLWELYDKHGSTAFLLESIATQAKQQEHPSVILVHAHLLRKAGKTKEAKARYQEVLKMEPKNAVALRSMTDLTLENGNREAALDFLKRYTETYPANDAARSPLLIESGKLLADIGKFDEAATAWEKAAALQPDNAALAREVAQLMLGAGLLDRALVFYRHLAKAPDPAKRLDALFDLSRMEEQADHFPQAVAALREGLALLHFKDWRYQQFFLRLVKAHERFGQLDGLKAELLKAANIKPQQEKALADIAIFYELTVDSDERMKWLRELVKQFPDAAEYRWKLVGSLVDHDGYQEAAKLLDEKLKNEETDAPSLVLLRCLAHLRAGEQDRAVARLRKLFAAQGGNADVEKQILAFAHEKSLDDVVETVLRTRIARDPEKPDAVFELAAFYRARHNNGALKQLLDDYAVNAGPSPKTKQEHINQVASFLSSGTDAQAAEDAARNAAAQKEAGRDEQLRLAEVLAQNGKSDEAQSLLEAAWVLSENYEKRTDVDERIFSLLAGEEAPRPHIAVEANTVFKMPAMFTGEGFGTDAPPEKKAAIPDAVLDYAAALNFEIVAHDSSMLALFQDEAAIKTLAMPSWPDVLMVPALKELAASITPTTPERTLRAAWWCFRTEQVEEAYALLQRLRFDENGMLRPNSLEIEKLLLDIALTDKNRMLALRQLRLLSNLDPANRAAYQRRLSEQYLEMAADPPPRNDHERTVSFWFRSQATKILEGLLKEDPQNESVISALAQCYTVDGKRKEALALWEKASQSMKGNASPLLERYAEALIAQRKFKEFMEVQLKLLESETDVKRRRELFERALQRMISADTFQGDLPDDEKQKRLEMVAVPLKDRTRRYPFDGFWHEALAGVYEKADDATKAFAEMKQAYYTSPDTPFSLDQLRAAALKVGDLKSAIYFQKQVAASAAAKEEAGEWRQLVQLLEQDFRMNEADQARRRLEARFSQDPIALDELAKYYGETGQDDASRRVHEQIARVRGWDGKALLQLAITQKRLGDAKAAEKTLRQLLAAVRSVPLPENTASEKWPWPLWDDHKSNTAASTSLLMALENCPGLEQLERERVRTFLSMPRAEFAEIPEESLPLRLRAIEELAKMLPAHMPVLPLEIERIWADYYAGRGPELIAAITPRLADTDTLEAKFLFVWMGLKSHRTADVLAWVKQKDLPEQRRRLRKGLVQAVTNVFADDEAFVFTKSDVEALGASGLFSNTELIDVARKLDIHRHHDLALVLGEAAKRNAPSLEAMYALFLSNIAESAGRVDEQRRYLMEVWRTPLIGSKASTYDPFLQSFTKLYRLAKTAEERDQLLRESWSRLQALPSSAQGTLREARLLGLSGATDASADRLAQFFSAEFISSRNFADPLIGRMEPGAVPLGSRVDDQNMLHSYWEETREWGMMLQQDGMTAALTQVDAAITQRNGGLALGMKGNRDFGAWQNQSLIRQLRPLNFPERIRVIRQLLTTDDSVEFLMEIGSFLESQGLTRESVEVYQRLPGRAPSNAEYCECFTRSCENSWDFLAALPYLEKLFDPATDPVQKPLTLNFEVLREKHAHFLAQLHDEPKLRALAFRGPPSKIQQGRVPEAVPYLKELALMQESQGDKAGALASLEQIHTLFKDEHEAAYRRAVILSEQGNKPRALEALRTIPLTTAWRDATRLALPLHAKLAAEAGLWDEVRELMNAVTGVTGKNGVVSTLQVNGAITLSNVLAQNQRQVEAQNLLIRAERSAREGNDRFRLRMEQLKLASAEASWNPTQERAKITSLLRTELTDHDALKTFVDWLIHESEGPRAKEWISELRLQSPMNANAALGLCAFSKALDSKDLPLMSAVWAKTKDTLHTAQTLSVETLLTQGKPQWAYAMALEGENQGIKESPLMVKILAAMKDRHGINELFAKVVRLSFPGGGQSVQMAEVFAEVGRKDLAEELYALALEQVRSTATNYPKLIESYTLYLISERRFEQAETLLLKENAGLTTGLAKMLVDLYQGWGRMGQIDRELEKFHLPIGVLSEARYLATSKK